MRHMVLAPARVLLDASGFGLPFLVAGVWVVDTPAPQGVGCVRFASGGGWWLVWSCGPTLRVLVAGLCQWLVAGVCGVASLNPRGGLRLVPHCGGWGVWLAGGGAARPHTPTIRFSLRATRCGGGCGSPQVGFDVGFAVVRLVWSRGEDRNVGFGVCAAWPRQRQRCFACNKIGWWLPPRPGVCFQ